MKCKHCGHEEFKETFSTIVYIEKELKKIGNIECKNCGWLNSYSQPITGIVYGEPTITTMEVKYND